MRVRIIKNNPRFTGILSIENYIGQVFDVVNKRPSGKVDVCFGSIGTMTISEDEYEIIKDNVKNDLDDYFKNYQRKYNFCNDDVVDFLLEHRDEILKILR